MSDRRPIGIFDSGVGGLTVARAILDLLPHERIVYVGDSRRFPYGPRPLEEIRRFALEIAAYLVSRDVKMLVVACNSIEVAAISDVTMAAAIPVLGVIEPGVRAAVRTTRNGRIGLIGTQATVATGAYDRGMATTGSEAALVSRACPAFVDFVERGDTASPELRELAADYLVPLRDEGVDTLILGCTHYPMLAGLISHVMGDGVVLVSSAEETAKDVYNTLLGADILAEDGTPRHEILCTGDPAQFRAAAEHFLGPDVAGVHATDIHLVRGGTWS